MAKKHLPIPCQIGDYMEYNPATGLLICLKKPKYSNVVLDCPWVTHPNQHGHLKLSFYTKNYYVHRVAWYLQTGVDPGELTVDHINGKPDDNRWSNLRLATQSNQMRNTGALGYSWDKRYQQFEVYIKNDNKRKANLGYEQCPLLARQIYVEEARKIFPDTPFVPRRQILGNPVVLRGEELIIKKRRQKISIAKKLEIFRQVCIGSLSIRAIAKRFNVDHKTVSRIRDQGFRDSPQFI